MPSKAATTRIDDTLAYISGYTGIDAQLVQAAHTLADGYIGGAQWNTARYTTKNTQNTAASGNYVHFSNHITMTDATTPGNKNQRARRLRAIGRWLELRDGLWAQAKGGVESLRQEVLNDVIIGARKIWP